MREGIKVFLSIAYSHIRNRVLSEVDLTFTIGGNIWVIYNIYSWRSCTHHKV